MHRKEPQLQVPMIPTTPANEAVAYVEKTCSNVGFDNVSSWSNVGFEELLALADAAWAHSTAIHQLPGNNDELKSQFKGDLLNSRNNALLSHHHLSLEQRSIILDNSQDPQGTSYNAYCRKTTSEVSPPTPDNAIRAERRQVAPMQTNTEENDQGRKESQVTNVPAKKLDNNGTPHSKELCAPAIEVAAVSIPFKENHKADSHDIDVNITPQQKPRRGKHCPKVRVEGKPKRHSTDKRKYERWKRLKPPTEVIRELTKPIMPESAKMSCKLPLNFDIRARNESSVCRENETVHLEKGIGMVVKETHVGFAHDLCTSMKQALNNYMSLPEDTQAPSTSLSKSNPLGSKPKENPAGKGLNKISTPPTEVTGELTKPMMPESAKMSCKFPLNFDIGAKNESSACRENETVHLGKEIDEVVEEMNVGLAYDLNTSMKQASNNYMSLPEDTQALSSPLSKSIPPGVKPTEYPTGKRKHVRRKRLNMTSTPPTEVREELTKQMMLEPAKKACKRSVNFDIGERDETSVCRENVTELLGKEIGQSIGMKHDKPTENLEKSIVIQGSFGASIIPSYGYTLKQNPKNSGVLEVHCFDPFKTEASKNKDENDMNGPSFQTTGSATQVSITHSQKISSRSRDWSAPAAAVANIASDNAKTLVAEMCASLTKKKRTKRKSAPFSSGYSSTNEMQRNCKFALENYHMPSDVACGVIRKSRHNVDALALQFRQLNINTEARDLAFREQNASVPYKQQNQKQNGLVYRDGTIIPFEGSFDPIRKQYPRPKVALMGRSKKKGRCLTL